MNCKDKQNGVQLPITYFRPTFEISVHQNYQAKIKYVYITVQSATLHCINNKKPTGVSKHSATDTLYCSYR